MITHRETKRMSPSDSNLHSLTGNCGHETFFGANYLRFEPDEHSVPCTLDSDGC